MSDLPELLKAAALVAIDDAMPGILADSRKLRTVTIELELAGGTRVRAGTCWVERAVNMNKLLDVSERRSG